MTDTYFVRGEAGNVGTPGAPILKFALVVAAGSGKVSGHVTITHGGVHVSPIEINVAGNVHQLGLGQNHQVVTLEGQYTMPIAPPPAIGSIVETYSSVFSVDHSWNGHGSFTYGGHSVVNVPVKSTSA